MIENKAKCNIGIRWNITNLQKVMDIHSVVQEDEFKRIFWEQQVIT